MSCWERASPGSPPTAYELAVVSLLAAGHSTGAIAARLVIGERTVLYHLANLLQRTECRSRAESIEFGRARGWIAGE